MTTTLKVENPTAEGKVGSALSGQDSESPLHDYQVELKERMSGYMDITVKYKGREMFLIRVEAAELRFLEDDMLQVFTPDLDNVYMTATREKEDEWGDKRSVIDYVALSSKKRMDVTIINFQEKQEIEIKRPNSKRKRTIKL